MIARRLAALCLASSLVAWPVSISGQTAAPERAVRRDIPLTNMIRRAYDASTRDSTGSPGANYWQLWLDYTINASLDPASSVVTGSETVVIHNQSPEPLTDIQLRLDHNIFRPDAVRLRSLRDLTDGVVVTRLTVDGESVNLNPPPRSRRRGQPAPPRILAIYGATTVAATVNSTDRLISPGRLGPIMDCLSDRSGAFAVALASLATRWRSS